MIVEILETLNTNQIIYLVILGTLSISLTIISKYIKDILFFKPVFYILINALIIMMVMVFQGLPRKGFGEFYDSGATGIILLSYIVSIIYWFVKFINNEMDFLHIFKDHEPNTYYGDSDSDSFARLPKPTQQTKTVMLVGILLILFSFFYLTPFILLFWFNYWVQKDYPRNTSLLVFLDNFVRFLVFLAIFIIANIPSLLYLADNSPVF